MFIDKFSPNYLTGIQEHVYKEFSNLSSRVRLAGMERDLDPGEIRAIAYFKASITILNHMGALKDDALDFIVPEIIQKTTASVWSE